MVIYQIESYVIYDNNIYHIKLYIFLELVLSDKIGRIYSHF